MNASGIKRGLATAAISALTVTGLPAWRPIPPPVPPKR